MKNYIVITTLNENNEVFATFHKAETMDVLARLTLANTLQQCILWNAITEMEQDKVYYLEADNESELETSMRTLGFRRCDRCNAWVTPQDRRSGASTWDGTTRLCAACIAAEENSNAGTKEISQHQYHFSHGRISVINAPGENYTLTDVKGVGIEMEMNSHSRSYRTRSGKIKSTPAFYAIAGDRSRNRHFFCEADCTVAAEFVSNIFTKKSMYDFDWSILTDQLKLMGNDESIASVGFHVHLSKAWLGENAREQALNFLKLQYILKAYENDWLKISGRKISEMHWCQFYALDTIERMKSNVLTASEGSEWYAFSCSHGDALISSGNTIELRIGKSTNDPDKIKHYLRLVLGIVENLKNIRFEKIYCMSKIFKMVPNETMNYWRKNGAFLNTIASDNRGISVAQAA